LRPALSIVFFTVTAGAGYGLAVLMVAGHHLGAPVALDRRQLMAAGIAALAAITLGLSASTLHLANPRNAWRAFARVRTSWLSREAALAVGFYPLALAYLALAWRGAGGALAAALGALVALTALATVYATAMIYACLPTIRQWRTPLTPVNYTLLALMLGALLLAPLGAQLGAAPSVAWTLLVVALALAAKLAYYAVIGRPGGPTLERATALEGGKVRLFDVGHTGPTFLTHEFGFELGARRALGLRIVSMTLAFALPALCLLAAAALETRAPLLWLAFASAYAGVLLERWLFFAEGRHVVTLYHGAPRT